MKEEIWQWIKVHPRLAVTGIVSILFVIGGWWTVSQLRAPEAASPVALTSTSSSRSGIAAKERSGSPKGTLMSSAQPHSSGPLYVDVKGAVKKPGVYQVQETMRVADVIALAQGLQPQADQQQVNLAAKVTDQQVIYVPVKGESHAALPSPGTTGAATSSSTSPSKAHATSQVSQGPININSADVTAFQSIKGIGQKKAQKIVDYRQEHGPFKSIDDLKNISGFGAKTIAKFKDQLTV